VWRKLFQIKQKRSVQGGQKNENDVEPFFTNEKDWLCLTLSFLTETNALISLQSAIQLGATAG
jgi:hypothetical protein